MDTFSFSLLPVCIRPVAPVEVRQFPELKAMVHRGVLIKLQAQARSIGHREAIALLGKIGDQ